MFCPKCKNDNLAKTSVCYYCGANLHMDHSISRGPIGRRFSEKNLLGPNQKQLKKWKPKFIDIRLPNNEGTVKVTFLKPPFIDDRKIRLQYRGVDGRFRRSTEIRSNMIKDIIEAVNHMAD